MFAIVQIYTGTFAEADYYKEQILAVYPSVDAAIYKAVMNGAEFDDISSLPYQSKKFSGSWIEIRTCKVEFL